MTRRSPGVSRVLLLSLFALAFTGCQAAGYYWHLASGHAAIMGDRQPLEEALASEGLAPRERALLEQVPDMLAFARDELAMPTGRAYRQYVALDRNWTVLNLVAAPEFSMEANQWCYPLTGCLGYRGYFDPARAEREAERLRAQGLEVYRGGAVAYSTLGWFADPILSPMLHQDLPYLAELLFHELAHRRFWLPGDITFNESLATSVGREGARRWLAARGHRKAVETVEQRAVARRMLAAMVEDTRDQLKALYDSGADEATMRARRQVIVDRLRDDFRQGMEVEPALARWASWMDGPLNNAQLNSFSDYHRWVPAFDRLLRDCDGDWPCFWAQVEEVAALPRAEREHFLEEQTHP